MINFIAGCLAVACLGVFMLGLALLIEVLKPSVAPAKSDEPCNNYCDYYFRRPGFRLTDRCLHGRSVIESALYDR